MSASNNFKFSIITICKNAESTIEASIISLLNQTYTNFEFIIVDGVSTDGTLAIAERYKNLVTKLVSEKDAGIYDAMNKGARLASGEYVYFLNCGDLFYSNDVLEKVAAFITQTNADVVYGDTVMYNPETNESTLQRYRVVDKVFLYNRPVNHQSVFARRSLFERVGFFDLTYIIKADHDWIIRCMNSQAKFAYIPVAITRYLMFGFAFQKRDLYTQKEKKRMQQRNYSKVGIMVLEILRKLKRTPKGGRLRALLNKII